VILPGLVVGFVVRRHAVWLSSLAYLLGVFADFCYHDGERLSPHTFLPSLRDSRTLPSVLIGFFAAAAIGAIAGLVAGSLRRRFGLISRIHAMIILALAAITITSLFSVTNGLRRHPNQENLIRFIVVVLIDVLVLYILTRLWKKFALPRPPPLSDAVK
jgi:uncharacterized membrane protein YeaQ/YmgE (transglycosylase-associated protein family)